MGRTRHPASPRRGLRSLAIGLITLATLLPGTASIAGADEDEDDPFVEPPQGTIEGVTDPTGQSSSAPPIVQEPAPAPDVAYPAPEGAKVPVAANATRAGRSPIAIRQTPEEPTAAPAEVDVEILGRDTAQKAGGQVLAFTVTPAALAPGRTDAPLTIEIDYSGFERAYGGDWTERVQLVQLPRCALVTPDQAKCRERTVVPLKRDYARKTWVADVDLEKSIESGGPGPREQVAGGGGVTFALTSGISGNTGTFGATSLSPSASWSVGANSGTFSWSRSLRVPPGTGGFTPEISINYSSGRLDGMTQTTNNQTSQLGLGWDISMNMFIERRYLSCRNDNDFSTYADDLCWIDHNATLYMNGGAQELVRQGVSNTWRLRSDPTWRVELLTGASNGALNGEYWRVTTTDGTQYFFGQDDANITGTRQSAWVVPVHGNAVGEPCNGGICMMGWRWMVNRIQDPRGNYVDVSWEAEWNRYAQTGNTVSTSGGWYVRGGFLSKVEYGRNVNIAPGTPWPQWIFFETSYRCITFDNDCVNHLDPDVDGPHWPDVPLDLRCPDGVTCNDLSPSFFSLRRLSVIDTQYWDNATGQHRHVTNYRLFHDFVDTDPIIDFSRMWLRWFQEQGRDPNDPNPAAGIWLPATRFDNFLVGQPDLTAHLPNRADTAGGTVPSLNLPRVSVIRDDIGKMTAIKYGQTFPCPPYYTGIWDQNLSDCFPQQVINAGTSGFGVFNKWLVQSVEERDSTTASSPSVLTTYSYEGTPAWHFSDDPIVANSQETWADWRGYLAVLVRKGSGATNFTWTRAFYNRGMDGDQCFSLPAPFCVGGLRVVNLGWLGPSCGVVPSEENSTPDSPWLAGAVKEITRLDSADGNIVQATRFWYSAGTSATQSTTHGGTRTAYIVRESAVESRVALSTGGQKCHYTVHALDADGFTDTDYLYGDRSDSTDDRCVTYLRSKNTSAWLLDYPYRVRQYGGLCTTEVARQDIAYDNLAIGTAPTRGAVTQTREYTTSTAFLTTGFVRDLYGRVTQVTMPNGYDTSGNLIGGGAGQRITTSYSPSVDNYTSITTSDQLGYVTTQSRDPRFGVITTTVNPRNAVTTVGYDLLGRVSTVILPTEQGTGTASQSYFYRFDTTNFSWLDSQNLKNPNTLQSYDLFMSSPNNWRERWTIFDGLARVRQEQSRSPAGSGSRIVTHTLYDDRGLLQRTTVPLYDSFNAPNGTIWPWIIPPSQASGEYTYGYDTLERLTVTQTRNGAATWTSTNTYEGDRVLASPPSGTAVLGTRTWLNGHGETRFVDELKPGGTWARTSYAYDGAGRLSTITNPAGNVTTSGYDRAGRRTSLTDPDQGAWTFVYDNNSNLTSQTDALAQTVASTFDNNNRITSKRVGTASGQLLASWTYANPGTSLAGLLTSSTAYDPNTLANGYTANYTAYDLRNRNTAKNVVVANEGALNGTFAFTYAYDPGDNLISMTYPAVGTLATGGLPAETVATGYNALGFIVNTTGTLPSQPSLNAAYVGNTLFNPDGTVSSREAGTSGQPNFFRQQSTYDSILRLASLNTRSGSSSTLRRVRSYTYDNISNITRIRDTTSGAAQSECFTYDHRARLIHAWTNTSSLSSSCTDGANPTWNVGPDPYRFVLTYSDIGNITSLATNAGAAQSYTYGAKPHAVTNVGGTAYTYNSNGEMLTGRVGGFNSSTLAWDRLHQLRSVANANGTTTFVYDADGERLIRRDPNGEKTLYVDGMEVKLQASALKVTRWYQHGGETVAVRQPGGALFWLGGNHQGSNEVAVNAGNGAITVQRFTPFGDLRPATSNLPGERAFLDEPRDPSEGLSYLNARYYDSKLLRFINPDPLMAPYSPQTLNAYSYALNNPVTLNDKSGKCSFWLSGGVNCDPFAGIPSGFMQNVYTPHWSDARIGITTSQFVHGYLQAASWIPIAGSVLSAVDAGLYAFEGDWENAAWATSGAIPFGRVANAIKAARVARVASEAGDEAIQLRLDELPALQQRADELFAGLHDIAQRKRTTAAMSTEEGITLVAGGSQDLARSSTRLQPGEQLARLAGEHAEKTALVNAEDRGFSPRAMAASRPFCPTCRSDLAKSGATLVGDRWAVWTRRR